MTARSGLSSPGRGVGVPPGSTRQGKSVCRPPVGSALVHQGGRGGKGKGQRWKANKEKKEKKKKRICKADKRQLKRKQEDTISESTKNKVSSVSLTRATQTSSLCTRASDSDLVGVRDTVTVTLLAASAAHTFCLKKNPNNLQGNLSITVVAKVGNARKQSARLKRRPRGKHPAVNNHQSSHQSLSHLNSTAAGFNGLIYPQT